MSDGQKHDCAHQWDHPWGGAAVRCKLCGEERCESECVSPRCPYRNKIVPREVALATDRVIEAARKLVGLDLFVGVYMGTTLDKMAGLARIAEGRVALELLDRARGRAS